MLVELISLTSVIYSFPFVLKEVVINNAGHIKCESWAFQTHPVHPPLEEICKQLPGESRSSQWAAGACPIIV